MSHYTEDQLSEYALRREAVNDARAVEEHLAGCAECRKALDLIETFDQALRNPLPWELADAMSARRGAPPELLAKARALAQEDAQARKIVMPLVDSPIRFRDAAIDSDPRFFTLAVIRLLCTVANQTHEHQPQFSLMIADAALAISANLPHATRAKAAWCTGTAWKERANALRYLGHFREAETALDEAEKAFRTSGCPEPFDLAIVSYVRASVYCEVERFDEAITAAHSAAEIFSSYGDVQRYLSSLMAEATAFYNFDRDQDAARLFERVVSLAEEAGETGILFRALSATASCYAHMQRCEIARDFYLKAREVIEDLDLPTEAARLDWALAALTVEQGFMDEGLAALDQSRWRLIQLGMGNDAALATLDLVAGLLAAGKSQRVPDLCRAISLTFSTEGITRNAKKALAYLAEAVGTGSANADLVRHVRLYIERLPMHPRQEFVQLQ